MPQMNGADAVVHLTHTDNTRDIPIAFITALFQKEKVRKRGSYIHGFPFITRPITKDELVQRVDSNPYANLIVFRSLSLQEGKES